ncbi:MULTISPECIES: hypothetical protein [Corynebacterium]|uniref:Or membrane protein n=1 Tax=Corynebacterium ihumii TaxID=1232427 RepID=A0ABY7UDP9_9CORY|nr:MULTISPECIES: hypothetical protein [Corynebacterium]MCG7292068.1 hypothetical protein [Corynebacterium afermentans]WCZ34805.1 hypothetical protein CIHUM_06955 [Corynebacterium ihumii]
MRNFRTAAVASATALTVLAGGTAIASAEDAQNETTSNDKAVVFVGKQEGDKDFGEVVSDGTEGLFGGKGSSQYFDDKDEPFYPTDAFGNKTNKEDVPQWARYWIDGSIVAAIGALVGLVIAGLNFSFYNGWLQHPLSR